MKAKPKNIKFRIEIYQDDAGVWFGNCYAVCGATILHAARLQSCAGAGSFTARALEAQAWLDGQGGRQ